MAGYEREIGALRTEARVVQGLGGVIVVISLAVLWQLFAMRGGMGELRAGLAGLRDSQAQLQAEVRQSNQELRAHTQRSIDKLRAEIQAGFALVGQRLPPATP